MMKKLLFVIPLLVFLAACASPAPMGGAAGPSDGSDATSAPAMPVATEERPLPPQTSPTLTPEPFASPYTAEMISPIFYGTFHDFILLGATSSGQWLQAENVYGLLYEDSLYDFYYGREHIGSGSARVRQPVSFGPPGYCNYISAQLTGIGGEPPSFGLKQGQPAVLRPVEEISVNTPLYQEAVAEWLLLQDVPSPMVNITRILHVDMEGDGVDEVLISASYFVEETGHNVVVGDYSMVLMRKVIGGDVYTVPLVQNIYYGNIPVLYFPPTYYLDNVFDLNGDGRYEVVVAGTWWEGSGYYVYEVRGINAMEVLKLVCGYVIPE